MSEEEKKPDVKLATWDDLCQSAQVVDKYYPSIDASIRYRASMAMERLLQLQARFNMTSGRGRRNSRGFFVAILKEVLIAPAVKSKADELRIMKMKSSIGFDIIGEVMGVGDETYQAMVEDLGEE